jgi:hypothetical protein
MSIIGAQLVFTGYSPGSTMACHDDDGLHETPNLGSKDDLQMTSYILKLCLQEPSRMS